MLRTEFGLVMLQKVNAKKHGKFCSEKAPKKIIEASFAKLLNLCSAAKVVFPIYN